MQNLSKIGLVLVLIALLAGCPQHKQYPPKITEHSTPEQAIMYLSWHLRANRGQFIHITQILKKYPQLKHFRHQNDEAVEQLLEAQMWQLGGMTHEIHQQIGKSLGQLEIISVIKKDQSLVFHIASTNDNNINSTYNLVFNPNGLSNLGHVSNDRKDRENCLPNYIQQQYPNKTFGSCYTQLMPSWYIHHAFQHQNN